MPEVLKETADEIAEATVEDNVGMFAFTKYDRASRGKISVGDLT